MVRPLDEAITVSGEGRIAKNTRVVNWINAVQVARDHTRVAATVAVRPSCGRHGAEHAQGGGDCKCDESRPSTHGILLLSRLLLSRRDTDFGGGFKARQELRHHM